MWSSLKSTALRGVLGFLQVMGIVVIAAGGQQLSQLLAASSGSTAGADRRSSPFSRQSWEANSHQGPHQDLVGELIRLSASVRQKLRRFRRFVRAASQARLYLFRIRPATKFSGACRPTRLSASRGDLSCPLLDGSENASNSSWMVPLANGGPTSSLKQLY